MRKFMSVMRPGPQDTTPSSKPSLRDVNGVPWITYSYKTRGGTKIFTVRVDIDSVDMADIPSEFQRDNCVYPSANGPEQEYKGIRRDYERQCNEQAWKLAHLNPTLLASNRGALGRAVVEMRNVYLNEKSRREKRQEMAERRERGPVEGNLRFRQQGPVLALTRTQIRPQYPQEQPGNDRSIRTQVPPAPTLSWQPTKVIGLSPTSSGQHPYAYETTSNHVRPEPSPIDSNTRTFSRPLQQEPMNAQVQARKFPTLGTFSVSGSSNSSGGSLEFESFVQGQFKRFRIRCDIDCIQVEDLPFDFKRTNCVYPRSFLADEGESQHWKSFGVRHAEESYLNEIGWKLRLLLQQALDAYRRRFLHATCQPRARVGSSLLTGRTSTPNALPETLARPGHTHHHPGHRRPQQQRVRFSDLELPRRKSADRRASHIGQIEKNTGTDDVHEEDDEEEEGDDEGEYGVEEQDVASEDGSSENESEDESSFSEGDGGFHSQMSLLTFTGSIRTYSLGTGSGSARSRPRISPAAIRSGSTASVDSFSQSHSSHPSTFGIRKRSTEAGRSISHQQGSSYGGKRARHHVSEEEGEEVESQDRTEMDVSTDEAENQDQGQDEDEDDWWMSRLQNSEYPEDQNLVSMTTEELIDALTSGYNSDVEDEEDDEDEDDDVERETFY
ncbi:hypothetical protein BGZ58_008002 [Dissophora ornata]|nr:hypothetical protein BGZ58_008002 [Dissophora ornata]